MTTTAQTDTRATAWARSRALCAALAPLLEYPTASGIGPALACRDALAAADSRAAEPASEFLGYALNTPLEEAQEDYARTFYVTPSCEPYVSVHLFGSESFHRGALMACLRERFEGSGFSHGTELPDHVAALLRFAALLDPEEFDDLARYCLVGPVSKMAAQLERARSPYAPAMRAAEVVLAEYCSDGD